MSNKLHTDKKLKKFLAGRRNLARKIGVQSANFFKFDVFNAQGFIDNTVKRWKPKQKGRGRILVNKGRGQKSIRPERITDKGVNIVANAPYMKYHNEGTKKLPQRKFLGNSNKLDKKNMKVILDFIDSL